jgi:hypothetical protein
MKTSCGAAVSFLHHGRFERWILSGTVLLSFVAGSLCAERMTHLSQVKADNNHVFELMVYHAVPGQAQTLESIFRDVSKLQAKHNLNVVGYWVPSEDSAWKDTFVYLVAHSSRDQAEANWRALHADPAFLPYRNSAAPLIAKVGGNYNVEEIYMRSADFSAMK